MISNILLIDDRKDFYETFRYDIEAQGWNLLHQKSLDGLKKVMPQLHQKLACVILDIKCLHTDDQEKESSDFIGDAITYLDQNFPKFPRVILTGDDKDFEGFKTYNKSESVYLKTPQGQKDLIEKLAHFIQHSVRLRIIRENPEAFQTFENNHLNTEKEKELIELLLALENVKDINLSDNIAKTRRFLEVIFKRLNELSTAFVPNEFITGDSVNLAYSIRFLSGLSVNPHWNRKVNISPSGKTLPDHIIYIVQMIKDVASSAGNHDYNERVTHNALFTSVYGLLELLVWFNDFMESKTNY
jgi:hypothetical protein